MEAHHHRDCPDETSTGVQASSPSDPYSGIYRRPRFQEGWFPLISSPGAKNQSETFIETRRMLPFASMQILSDSALRPNAPSHTRWPNFPTDLGCRRAIAQGCEHYDGSDIV